MQSCASFFLLSLKVIYFSGFYLKSDRTCHVQMHKGSQRSMLHYQSLFSKWARAHPRKGGIADPSERRKSSVNNTTLSPGYNLVTCLLDKKKLKEGSMVFETLSRFLYSGCARIRWCPETVQSNDSTKQANHFSLALGGEKRRTLGTRL